MRLWTYQNKDVLKVLKKGVWYSTKSERLHEEDKKFVSGKNYPIYTFSKMRGTALGISSLCLSHKRLTAIIGNNFTEFVLVEMEVPEDVVLSTKLIFKKDGSTNSVTKDHLNYIRNQGYEDWVESLIPCIKKEWIVSIKEIKEVRVECWEYETTYKSDKYPLSFNESILISNRRDTFSFKENGKYIEKKIHGEMTHGLLKLGMQGYPEYFTKEEIYCVCNGDTVKSVASK